MHLLSDVSLSSQALSFVCPSMVRPSPCFSYFRIQRAHFPGSRETFEMLLAKSQLCVAFRNSCGSLTWHNILSCLFFLFFPLRLIIWPPGDVLAKDSVWCYSSRHYGSHQTKARCGGYCRTSEPFTFVNSGISSDFSHKRGSGGHVREREVT